MGSNPTPSARLIFISFNSLKFFSLTQSTHRLAHKVSSFKAADLLAIRDVVVAKFTKANWLELGLLTEHDYAIRNHSRLLRSLDFGDDDYAGHALEMLSSMMRQPENGPVLKDYVEGTFGSLGENVSSKPRAGRTIVFQPGVFEIPEVAIDPHLVAVMMPFAAEFNPVFEAIKLGASRSGMNCQRVSDIWEHSTVVQDIFSLIYRSKIVVCDFSGRNSNVFYEAGIAHTLGRHVVPITQSKDDIPFDLQGHRYLPYLNNQEGRRALAEGLQTRFDHLTMGF